jgi:methyl-accepting chemotaxis protein
VIEIGSGVKVHSTSWDRDETMSYRNLSMAWKVLLLLAMLGLSNIGSTIYTTMKMSQIDDTYSDIIAGPAKASVYAARANRILTAALLAIYQNAAATVEADKAKAATVRKDAEVKFASNMAEAAKDLPSKAAELQAFAAEATRIIAQDCAKSIALSTSSDAGENARALSEIESRCEPPIAQLNIRISAFNDALIKSNDELSDRTTDQTNATARLAYAISFGGLLLVCGISFWLVQTGIAKPMQQLLNAISRISSGDLSSPVDGQDRRDEVGAIARGLLAFRDGLADAERMRAIQQAEKDASGAALARRAKLAEAFVARMEQLALGFGRSSGEVADAARNLSATAEETLRQAQSMSRPSPPVRRNCPRPSARSMGRSASRQPLPRRQPRRPNGRPRISKRCLLRPGVSARWSI